MRTRGLLALLLLALALGTPAHAATRTIRLTNDGPVPKSLTLTAGDRVVFVNDDTVPHQVSSQGAWQYDSGPLPPRQTSSATPALTAPGTYRYSDVRGIVVLPQTFTGALVVPAKPKASPKPTPTATTSKSPRPQPTFRPTLPPSPVATPTASPTPSLTPTPAATSAAPSPTPAPHIAYGDNRALIQSSPHKYGLPVLLGLVGIGGVISLLIRYLLSLA